MFERLLIALHAAAVASLALVAILSLSYGSRFELLTLNAGPGPWVWLGAWLALAGLGASQRRPVAIWRLGLGACGVSCCTAALLGVLRRAPLAAHVAAVLVVLAAGFGALALALDERRVLRVRSRRGPSAGAGMRPLAAGTTARAPARAAARGATAGHARGSIALAWGLCVVSFCVFFTWARARTGGVVEATGHAGMLVVFFVLVPAASVSAWFPRSFATAWLLAGASMAWLALHAERPALLVLALGVALCAVRRFVRGGRALAEKAPA